MGFITFLIVGLSVGFVSHALGTDGHGALRTALVATLGSLLGGLLSFINADGDYLSVRPSGLVYSLLGAMGVLFLAGAAEKITAVRREGEENERAPL